MRTIAIASIGFAVLTASQAHALSSSILTFGTLPNGTNILNYFDGGLSAYPNSGTGPNDGVVFSANANEQKGGYNAQTGGTGKFENNPSGVNGVLYFAFSTTATSYFNDANGFTALSFDYSLLDNLASYGTTADLWSQVNGTGTLLATLALTPSADPVACMKYPSHDEFCSWSYVSASNFGTAYSVTFPGTASSTAQVEFDDLILPEPASLALFGLGVAGLALVRPRNPA